MRRAATVLLVLPVLLAPGPAHADEPGSGFASLSLSAVGSGESWVFSPTTQVPGELSVPYAAATYNLGAGTATSTVAWPGEVAASLGSAAIAVGAPPQADMLNDPVLARARTGSGAADVSNDTLPGTTMDAHATPDDVHAATQTAQVQAAGTVATATSATAKLLLTGASTATAEATSAVRDVTVGVVHVGAVVSRATGTTDGLHATAQGSTVVTGLTVAGTQVTVDGSGLHVAGTTVPAAQALAGVESALAKAGMTLQLGQPTTLLNAGRAQYATGSLVLTTPLGVLSLGGAQLTLSATLSDVLTPPPPPVQHLGNPGPPAAPQPAAATGPLPASGGVGTPSSPVDALPPVLRDVVGALAPLAVTTGYGWSWLPVGLALALLAGAAMRRLPAAVLPGVPLPCPTEDLP